MATIINTPSRSEDSSGAGLVIGVIVAIILLGLFFMYALPAMRNNSEPTNSNIKVEVPNPLDNGGGGGTQNSAPSPGGGSY